jgi:hypothetical protein
LSNEELREFKTPNVMRDADAKPQHDCQSEEAAAYLDGEMDDSSAALFELHLKDCATCTIVLHEQRRLLCTLDFALGVDEHSDLRLPKNFAQIVTAHAQSDLSSLRRERAEHKRAFRLCLILAVASFALLGGAAWSESVLQPLGLLVRHAGTIFGFMGRALYDFGAGLAVIARAIGGHTIFESNSLAALAFLLLAVALILLPRLISNYHRARITLDEAAPRRSA